ncbi:hypothetical protein V5740_13185 [Croceibacterium sp. TMG7-5b_MA50]|uniref:hypothetical protein n=1 Tax=Croceibacterium sp. TMG7-5b_MA50 TaxID=3121290 RepID=UPI003221F41D
MSAIDFVARAIATQATAAVPQTFADHLRAAERTGLNRIDSIGHSESGLGAATYLSDLLADEALFRDHPAAVIAMGKGKFLRLAGDASGYVTPEQLGCPRSAPGVNQQPYIQAAIAYAEAVGLRGVLLSQPRYELWAPVRPDGLNWLHPAGSCLVVSKGIVLRGSGAGRVILECRNAVGGRNDNVVQQAAISDWQADWQPRAANGKVPWIGSAILVDPAAPVIDELLIENIEIDGTAAEASEPNRTHCGLHLQGNVRRLHLRDFAIHDCAGDLYVRKGSSEPAEELLENCVFAGTPAAAILSVNSGPGRYLNVVAGRAGTVEIVSTLGHHFNAVRLHDMPTCLITGSTDGELQAPGQEQPYSQFHEVLVENVAAMQLGAHLRGRLKTTDTTVVFLNRGRLEDVELEIDAWADRKGNFDAVTIAGPQDRVTPIPGSETGAFYAVPSFLTVQISGRRTARAAQSGHCVRTLLAMQGGLLDQDSVSFTLTGTAGQAFDLTGTVPTGGADQTSHPAFRWPWLTVSESFQPLAPAGTNLTVPAPGAFDLVLRPGIANSISAAVEGIHTARLLHQFGMADGQRARISLSDGDGKRIIRIAQAGMGARLPEDRHLCRTGDYIELRWDAHAQVWVETAYSSSESRELGGTLTIENALEVQAGDVASFDIQVPGANTTDCITGLVWGQARTGALQISPVISASGLVTVHLHNPALTAITIPEGTQVNTLVRRNFLPNLPRNPALSIYGIDGTSDAPVANVMNLLPMLQAMDQRLTALGY